MMGSCLRLKYEEQMNMGNGRFCECSPKNYDGIFKRAALTSRRIGDFHRGAILLQLPVSHAYLLFNYSKVY